MTPGTQGLDSQAELLWSIHGNFYLGASGTLWGNNEALGIL